MKAIVIRPSALFLVAMFTTITALAQPCATILISSVTPPSGPSAGGTTVTLTSANAGFYGCFPFEPTVPTVKFGGVAGSVTSYTASQIVVTTPLHAAGVVDVIVDEGGFGSGTISQAFTFIDPSAVPALALEILFCLAIVVAGVAFLRLN